MPGNYKARKLDLLIGARGSPKAGRPPGARKIRLLLLMAGVLMTVILIAAAPTIAELNTKTGNLDNKFAFGQTGVTVDEHFDGWNAKEVKLTASSGPGYVPGVARAMMVPYIVDASGNYLSVDLGAMPATISGNTIVLGDITLELASDWSTNWFYKDGYFYYRQVLQPGQTTALLLQKVSLTSDTPAMHTKYAGTDVKVEVMAEILQAEGGAPAANWGVTVTGEAVTP